MPPAVSISTQASGAAGNTVTNAVEVNGAASVAIRGTSTSRGESIGSSVSTNGTTAIVTDEAAVAGGEDVVAAAAATDRSVASAPVTSQPPCLETWSNASRDLFITTFSSKLHKKQLYPHREARIRY